LTFRKFDNQPSYSAEKAIVRLELCNSIRAC
jgi:hypothetical protein